MEIKYAVADKREAHIVRIGLLTTRTQYKRDSAGEIVRDPVTKQAVEEEVPVINEVLGRASHFKSLTPTQRLAYAQECEKWHHKRDATVRAKWDADDKNVENAKFIRRNAHLMEDGNVAIDVAHHGRTTTVVIPNDIAKAEANAREAFAIWEAGQVAKEQSLAAFNG